jgi:hypothetical protein
MAHLIASNDCRFGRTHDKRIRMRARGALTRANSFLKNMIEAIADSKMRRIERELELRGYRYDRSGNDWMRCDADRSGIRKG